MKWKISGRQEAFEVKDKPNLNKIFESYISFQDLQTFLDYIVKHLKHLFAMI